MRDKFPTYQKQTQGVEDKSEAVKEESISPNEMICQCLTDVRPFKALDEGCVGIRIQALEESFLFRRRELEDPGLVSKRAGEMTPRTNFAL